MRLGEAKAGRASRRGAGAAAAGPGALSSPAASPRRAGRPQPGPPLRHSRTYVKTKNKVVEPTNKAAAVETGMYFVGLNLFPVLLGIL